MSSENIKEKIAIAKKAVENEDEPYKLEAFKIIVEKLLEAELLPHVRSSLGMSNTPTYETTKNSINDAASNSSNPLEVLATKCQISIDQLKNLIDMENDQIIILKKIDENVDSKKQVKASQIALAAYMKGLNKEWTKGSVLRELIEKNNLGDSGNIAKNLKNAGFFRIKGEGKATEYSLTTDGWQQGLDLIKSLCGV